MPHSANDDTQSVFLNQMPEKSGIVPDDEFVGKWEFIYGIRETVNKILEEKRNEKIIGKSLEAKVIVHCSEADYEKYSSLADQLKDVLIVSDFAVEKNGGDEAEFEVVKAEGGKCERCWCYSKYVGTNHDHPTLCERCSVAIEA